jgi:signal recognition particle subunit SRP68
LSNYPSSGIDLENIVAYPPRLEHIPVKPLFLDVAWNYINYPNKKAPSKEAESVPGKASGAAVEPETKPQKRGWFGFGR